MTIRTGTTVRWRWGSSWAEGTVAEVHHDVPAPPTAAGHPQGRHDNPAYVVEQEDGTVVLKLSSEVERA